MIKKSVDDIIHKILQIIPTIKKNIGNDVYLINNCWKVGKVKLEM